MQHHVLTEHIQKDDYSIPLEKGNISYHTENFRIGLSYV
jgi:hypothetical protein